VNLLENTRRFSAGHPVEMRACEENGRVVVRVIDQGPGILEEPRPLVFEPFLRGEDESDHAVDAGMP
jgi:K+-sensing histidine kinase KdpD